MKLMYPVYTLQRRFIRWLGKLIARPPSLVNNYDMVDYFKFMSEETFLYSKRYVRNSVVIHNASTFQDLIIERGAVLAPLHYGSFFLIGGSIFHQLRVQCTAIVTHNNLLVLPSEEAAFWRGVHNRSQRLQDHPLFYAGLTPRNEITKYLSESGNVLWAMLDVREVNRDRKEFPFLFMQREIYLQTSAANLACLSRVPFVPVCIQFNKFERRHHLYFGSPIFPVTNPVDMTQQALTQLEKIIAIEPAQFFHEMSYFSKPSAASNEANFAVI